MSIERGNNIISKSNIEIMEYLIQKLESRERNLSKYSNIFSEIDSFDSFHQKRKDIFILFKNLEEELHQAAFAIKALMNQNKAISQENLSNKILKNNYNKLLQENNYLLIENNNFAQELKELKNKKNKNGTAHKVRNPSFNNFSTAKFNNFNDIGNNYQPLNRFTSTKKINNSNIKKKIKKKNDNYKKKNADDIYNFDLELNEIDKLKNIKNIMQKIKSNKNKLKEAIEQHFAKNAIQ
jgi:flagellar biosynthesis GTPase FlhF